MQQEATSRFTPKKLNDCVYEICTPKSRPSAVVVGFHGMQFENWKEPHVVSWASLHGSQCWLLWLIDEFPDARILVVSHDCSPIKSSDRGRMDMSLTGEMLLYSLMGSLSQGDCPIFLVGHGIGGLVMKEVCLQAHSKSASDLIFAPFCLQFCRNLQGLFFLSTPHHGSHMANDMIGAAFHGSLVKILKTQSVPTVRQSEKFRSVCKIYNWSTFGIGASHEDTVNWRINVNKTFRHRSVIVTEGSARGDLDGFFMIPTSHTNMCRPEDRTCTQVTFLITFIKHNLKMKKEILHYITGPKHEVDPNSGLNIEDHITPADNDYLSLPLPGRTLIPTWHLARWLDLMLPMLRNGQSRWIIGGCIILLYLTFPFLSRCNLHKRIRNHLQVVEIDSTHYWIHTFLRDNLTKFKIGQRGFRPFLNHQ